MKTHCDCCSGTLQATDSRAWKLRCEQCGARYKAQRLMPAAGQRLRTYPWLTFAVVVLLQPQLLALWLHPLGLDVTPLQSLSILLLFALIWGGWLYRKWGRLLPVSYQRVEKPERVLRRQDFWWLLFTLLMALWATTSLWSGPG